MTATQDSLSILRSFERRPDGSWVCLEPAVIVAPSGPMSVEPGQTFAYGKPHGGLDIAEYLEQLGA